MSADRCVDHGGPRCPTPGPDSWLGTDTWGNVALRHLVVPRRDPEHAPGVVVADFGCNGTLVAYSEDGIPYRYKAGEMVGVGSPAHIEALVRVGGES